jgi:hypothetical protein
MDIKTINTPEKLHQAIVKFLESDYSHEDLVKMYDDARKCVIGFQGTYPALPPLPSHKDNPLDGLQNVMDWCIKSSKAVDDIVFNLDRQTISAGISQFKKLRDFAGRLPSLVNIKLREQAQKEARAKVEKEYKNLNEKASRLNEKASRLKIEQRTMPLDRQEEVFYELTKDFGELQLEEQEILRRETKEAVQIYLSKDPTFEDRLSQRDKEIPEVTEKINKLAGSNTPTGKLLDIYCKLKDIPLQQQYNEIGYAYPYKDLTDVICGGCNRLYTSVDNVIKTFEEIQAKAGQQDKLQSQPVQGTEASGGKANDMKNQEWSKPMSKTEMMKLLEIDDCKKFNKWADQYGIKKLGQKTFQIRLDNMDQRSRQKLDPQKI